ncbi:T9SS type B sorting domain-containing protein [Flavobacterium piscis]|uniref:Gliding motility-associated-like protein n=1 Tax=Flavobacterium piscis TaxID=1114874 RepID=A0ABU1Y4A6_9FLAO|nr:T9SS type B sorting domain-containing protein [Flavobacterium piscis]MDR7209054.1 gliding motility-associated-like protein [Flavobacterium piscis]
MKISAQFIFILFILATPSFAQKEAAIWFFGNYAGLDFNSGSPVALTNGKLITKEGCATISDKDGNLLFYTDGSIVYNKNHQIMPNGSGLLGHNSSTQSAIIVPKPNNPYVYYIFTVDQPLPANADDNPLNDMNPPNNGLNYSQVDIRLNNGLGDIVVTEKNVPLVTYDLNDSEEVKYKCSEKITAVQHGDGVSFWVITHFINNFYAFKISAQGVNNNPVKTTTALTIPIGGYLANAIGCLKASPNGKKIVIANNASRRTNENGPKGNPIRDTGNVLLYDFDSSTGITSNEMLLLSNSNPYGVEFSSKTKKIYVTANKFNADGETILESSLIQYDLKSANILSSKTIVNTSPLISGALQLGIDEKIYCAGYLTTDFKRNKISVINNPELDGTSCNYLPNAIDLKTGSTEQGLPPFITSLFLYTFSYEFNCFGQATHFFINSVETIDSVVWDFGDGTTSTDREPYHTYLVPGDYKVTLIKTVNGENREPVEKNIVIYETPSILGTPYKLIQCDTRDAFPSDGVSIFNLSLANEPLCLGQKDFEVTYYHSIVEAENDTENIQSIPVIYQNNVRDEIVYAKVFQANSSCYNIGTIILHVNKNIAILPESYNKCDIGDGSTLFDLDQKKVLIKIELSLPSDVVLFFYSNKNDADLGKNELKGLYSSTSKTLFIRAENKDGCYGTGQFDLVVEPTPKINPLENMIICEGTASPSVILDAGILAPDIASDFSYLWSTNEITPTITVAKEGEYTVIVKNKYGCTATHKSIVSLSYTARINNIIVNDILSLNNVMIEVANPSNYQYMIKFENGTTTPFQSSPIFINMPGGFHEIIIENIDGCGQIRENISVLDAPAFFTPNNDGYNDYWNVKGVNTPFYTNSMINIFDRYGKLIKQMVPLSNEGWDGNFNGFPLPSDDYWYTIKLEDGREGKGHFSLKR